MAKLTKCKDCGHEVSKKAKTCPSCGVSKPAVKSVGLGKLFLLGIFGFFVYMVAFGPDTGSSYKAQPKTAEQIAAEKRRKLESRRESYAIIIAEQEMSKRLKAPATADFSSVLDTRIAHLRGGGPNDWIVKGYVDAQNSFGAMIRNNYQVVIEFEEGKHDSYRIRRAEFYE